MTTNVFDGPVGLVATDSRWSIQRGRWLIYLDDTNFDKIELTDAAAFMFAGSAVLIEKWKLWIRSNPPDASGMPELQDFDQRFRHQDEAGWLFGRNFDQARRFGIRRFWRPPRGPVLDNESRCQAGRRDG